MRKKYIFGKKLYISIITSILVLLTTVATTFAWVGVFANSTFEMFDINIKGSKLEEYNIQISLTGEADSFGETISFEDLYKQILINCGYDESVLTSNERIELLYKNLDLDQCTTLPVINGNSIQKLGEFYDLWGQKTKMYFKFDFYISCDKAYDKGDSGDFHLDVYLGDRLLTGTVKTHSLVNAYTYPLDFDNPLSHQQLAQGIVPYVGGDVVRIAKTDSSSAARVAFEKYPVVPKGHPELYDSIEPVSAKIYQKESNYPFYNETTGVQSFGGILPDEYNLATMYYNSTEWKYYSSHGTIKSVSISDEMYSARGDQSVTGDLVLSSVTNHLIDSTNVDEQIGVDQMMKVTCYFWFEGWDADCIPSINYSPVKINISLNMSNEEVF